MPDFNVSLNEGREDETHEEEESQLKQAKSKFPEKEIEASGSDDGKMNRLVPLGNGDGGAQPKAMKVCKKTPVGVNETNKVLDKMLTVLTTPKKKTNAWHISGIPRCISSQKFQDIMKKKEQEKKEVEEAKEHKRKCLENAVEKKRCQEEAKKKEAKKGKTKSEKAKATVIAVLAAPRPKQERRALKKFDDTSSSDSKSSDLDAIVYEDSLDSDMEVTTDTFEGSTSFCAKCLTVFKGREKESTIGCDTPYCR